MRVSAVESFNSPRSRPLFLHQFKHFSSLSLHFRRILTCLHTGNLQADMNRQGVTTTQKGCCSACDKPIVGQVITALGRTWHPEHFTCSHCCQELGTRSFFERDGHPYCEPDYHNLFSPRCAYCNGAILDVRQSRAKNGYSGHLLHCGGHFCVNLQHFRPGQHSNRFPLPFSFACRNASPHWTKHGTQSTSSAHSADSNSAKMVSMNGIASRTSSILTILSFSIPKAGTIFTYSLVFCSHSDGKPYCRNDYFDMFAPKCAGCNRSIMENYISALNAQWHADCFVCRVSEDLKLPTFYYFNCST